MSNTAKIIVTILIVLTFLISSTFLLSTGISKTFIALLGIGLFYGIRALWKDNKKNNQDSNEIKLDKTGQKK